MSAMHSVGSFLGKTAATAYEGSRLASTQLAIGYAEGYASRAEELRAKRAALLAGRDVVVAPPQVKKVGVKHVAA